MRLNDYQAAASTTAIYPGRGFGPLGLAYVALGLVNEIGELLEKCTSGANDSERNAEAGDVLWYCAMLVSEVTGEPFGDATGFESFTDIEPAHADSLRGAAATIAGQAKKVLRDNPDEVEYARRATVMVREVGRILQGLASIVGSGNVLDGCAEGNVAKLASRAERGTLTGDGDVR